MVIEVEKLLFIFKFEEVVVNVEIFVVEFVVVVVEV